MEPLGRPHLDPVLRAEGPRAPVYEHAPHEPRKLGDRAQPGQQSGVVARLGFDLDRREFRTPAEEEIHLGAVRGMGRPVSEVLVQVALLAMCPQKVKNPAFEKRSALLGRNRTAALGNPLGPCLPECLIGRLVADVRGGRFRRR